MTTKTAAKTDQPTTCKCGCGEAVERSFKQGHDQRLISKLARDLVYRDVWSGRCLGILAKAEVNDDIQKRLDKVAGYVSERLSPALAAKFENAAHRAWELQKTRDTRSQAKRERADKPERERKAKRGKGNSSVGADVPETNAEVDAKLNRATPKLITKATASNDDVDAAEVELESGGHKPGQTVRVLIGKRKRNAVVRGMNQAGKITAVAVTTNGKETVKTEGEFMVLGNRD